MGNISSINFKAAKTDSEAHNFRKKTYDYIRTDLTIHNLYWSQDTIKDRLDKIEAFCKKTSGRKLQKNAMPIREAVVVIDENTTMLHLQNLSDKLNSELGINVFQIVIHKDEGHYDIETKVWKPNFHAHLVADWQDKNTGKTLKHKPLDYVKMQDITADCLGMERGQRGSTKVRLEAMEFKLNKKEEEFERLSNKVNLLIKAIDVNNFDDLTVESKSLFGSSKIDYEKTLDNFRKLIQSKDVQSVKNEQLLKLKEKQIDELKLIVSQLNSKILDYTHQKSKILTNPDFFNDMKSEFYESVTKLLRKEIFNYRNKNRFKIYKEKNDILIVLNEICKEISIKNDIPFSIFIELNKSQNFMYSCFDLITKGKISKNRLDQLDKKSGLKL